MAIIRKGDAEAEAGLKARAKEQRENRRNASDNQLQRAGLVTDNVYINPKTKKAHTLDLGNSVTGNAYALSKKQFSGPISGSAMAKKHQRKERVMLNSGSGVVQGGKVIKGGEIAKNVAKKQRQRKKAMDK